MSKLIKLFTTIITVILCCTSMASCGKSIPDIREELPFGHIDAGTGHTVGLQPDGTVVARGFDYWGETHVSDWRDIVAVSASWTHTIGLKSDGTVIAVGDNREGQCNVSEWTDIIAISAGLSHSVGLKSDGTVVATGVLEDAPLIVFDLDEKTAQTVDAVGSGRGDVSDWTNIVAIAAGNDHTIGLKSNGKVLAAGGNLHGKCDVSDWKDIVAIATDSSHTVGLKSNGRVVATGLNDEGQCDVSGWRNIVAIATGKWHTVGLRADGRVVAVGYNEEGQCEVSDWRDIVAIAAGERYTIGIKSDGSVVAVGQNSCGQCDLWDWNLAVKPFTQNIISSETIVNKQDIPANATSNQSAFGTNQVFFEDISVEDIIGIPAEKVIEIFGEPESYIENSTMEYGMVGPEWICFYLSEENTVVGVAANPEKFTFDGQSLAQDFNTVVSILGDSYVNQDNSQQTYKVTWYYGGNELTITFFTEINTVRDISVFSVT